MQWPLQHVEHDCLGLQYIQNRLFPIFSVSLLPPVGDRKSVRRAFLSQPSQPVPTSTGPMRARDRKSRSKNTNIPTGTGGAGLGQVGRVGTDKPRPQNSSSSAAASGRRARTRYHSVFSRPLRLASLRSVTSSSPIRVGTFATRPSASPAA